MSSINITRVDTHILQAACYSLVSLYTKKEILNDSVSTAAIARGFTSGFCLRDVRNVLLWSWSSRRTTGYRQVARDRKLLQATGPTKWRIWT